MDYEFKKVSSIDKRLKERMDELGMKQIELCRATGIDKGSISHYLAGGYKLKEMEEHFAYVEVEHGYMDNGYEYYNFPKPIDEKEYRKRKAQGPVEIHVEEGYRSHDKVFSEVYEFD